MHNSKDTSPLCMNEEDSPQSMVQVLFDQM